jgi:hypothetical protein
MNDMNMTGPYPPPSCVEISDFHDVHFVGVLLLSFDVLIAYAKFGINFKNVPGFSLVCSDFLTGLNLIKLLGMLKLS